MRERGRKGDRREMRKRKGEKEGVKKGGKVERKR